VGFVRWRPASQRALEGTQDPWHGRSDSFRTATTPGLSTFTHRRRHWARAVSSVLQGKHRPAGQPRCQRLPSEQAEYLRHGGWAGALLPLQCVPSCAQALSLACHPSSWCAAQAPGFAHTPQTTVPDLLWLQRGVSSAPPDLLAQALSARIMTFGSPSAVKAWVALAGMQAASEKVR